MVKDLPAIQETQVRSLGQEDPLEKKMATHSSILAWRIPWTEEPGRLQSMRSQRVGHNWAANTFTFMMKYDGGGLVAKLCPIIWNIVITKQLGLYGGFPGSSHAKESSCNARLAGDTGSIPGLVRSPGEGNGNPPLKPQIMGKCLTLGIVTKLHLKTNNADD